MRELKFRVWASNTEFPNGKMYTDKFLLNLNGDLILPNRKGDFDYSMTFARISFNNINSMQYINSKDKNGKEICEGDIVIKKDKDWFITDDWEEDDIRWEDTELNIPLKEVNRDYVTLERLGYWLKNESFGYEGEDLQNPLDYEVIGNIYENPELLDNITIHN